MAIDPQTTDTVSIPQLDPLVLALETFLVGSNANGFMGNFTAQQLADFIAPYVSAIGSSPFVANTGSPLPNPIEKETAVTFVGIGTFDQTTGSDVTTTEELNVLFWSSNGVTGTWTLGIEIPIDLTDYVLKVDAMAFATLNDLPTNSIAYKAGTYALEQSDVTSYPNVNVGFINRTTGLVNTSSTNRYTDFIPLAGGWDTIRTRISLATTGGGAFYSAANEGAFIVGSGIAGTDVLKDYPIPPTATHFRSYKNFANLPADYPIYLLKTFVIEDGEVGYIDNDVLTVIDFVNNTKFNTLFDKNIGKTVYIGSTGDLTTYTSATTITDTRIYPTPIANDCQINQIDLKCVRAGIIEFNVYSRNPDLTFNWLRTYQVNAQVGVNTYKEPGFVLNAGEYLGYSYNSTIGFIAFKTETATFITLGSQDPHGSNMIQGATTTTINFGVKFTTNTAGSVGDQLYTINNDIAALQNNVSAARKLMPVIGTIQKNDFYTTSLPTDWVENGGFVATTSGLQSPVSGGWGVYAYWNKHMIMDEDAVLAKIIVNDITSIFSIARQSDQGGGTAIEVDFQNSLLSIYTELLSVGATPASKALSIAIPFVAVVGREYHVKIKKVSENYYGSLYDTVTQATVSIYWNAVGSGVDVGKMWNFPGIIFRQGNIKMIYLSYSSTLSKSPKFLAVGDSIMDCDTIRTLAGGGYTNRWIGKLSANQNYAVSIFAKGGEDSATFNAKLPLVDQMIESPRFSIYGISANDTTFATWQANMLTFKAAIEAKGSELILMTAFPRSGREAFAAAVNAYIIPSGIRYIDSSRALTIGGDRVTRNTALLQIDQLHPNVDGQLAIYNQALIDLADIL